MSILDSVRKLVTFETTLPPPLESSGPSDTYAVADMIPMTQIGKPVWPTWDPAKASRDGYSRLALIYRCINVICHAIGTATIRVYDEANDNETIPDHPMRLLMRRPNPQMGEAAFWGTVGLRSAVAGFCLCEKERDRIGNVIGLWPLHSSWLKAIGRRNSAPDWQYRIPGQAEPYALKAEDVVAFRWADTPDGSPYGMGPLEACLREVALSNAMMDFVKGYIERGAVPVHAIIPESDAPQMTAIEVEELLDEFVRKRGGVQNAARPIYLQSIKDIKRIGLDLNELAYEALRDLSDLAICTAFGVPPHKVGVRAGLQHTTQNATAKVEYAAFYNDTIMPLWTRFDDALTLGLLIEFDAGPTITLEFDTSKINALQDDRNAKAAWLGTDAARGVISIHTYHRELGLPLPLGDDYYLRPISVEAVPVTDPLPVAAPPLAIALPGLAGQRPPLALHATTGGVGYQGRLAKAVSARKRIARIADAREPSIRAYLDAQAKRVIPKVLEGLAKHNQEMETHGTLTMTPGLERSHFLIYGRRWSYPTDAGCQVITAYAMEDINWHEEDEKLRKELQRLYLVAGESAFEAVAEQGITIGIDFSLANPNVKHVIAKLATRVTEIGNQTRSDIAERVSAGLDAGKSLPEIADSLRGLYDETYAGRSMAIARTESMVSYGEASVLGYKESGVIDRAQIFDNPAHTEPYDASDGLTCAERDGLVVPLDEAMDHIYADHPNGSAVASGVLTGESVG